MARTAREHCFSFILIGIMILTIIILYLIFGLQPLSNPLAVGILLMVVIISFCLLSLNRVIINAIKRKSYEKSQDSLICPVCNILVDKKSGIRNLPSMW